MILILGLIALTYAQVTITSTSFTAGGVLTSTFASTLSATANSVTSAGTIPNIVVNGATGSNVYSVFTGQGAAATTGITTFLWGTYNIAIPSPAAAVTVTTSTGTFLTNSYSTTYNIATPTYLGPNRFMTSGIMTTYAIYVYQAAVPGTAPTTTSALYTAYGTAVGTPANGATISFTYAGPVLTLTSTSFTTGTVLPATYSSTLNSNGSLNSAGTLPNFAMGGAVNNAYHIYCTDGTNYLWGSYGNTPNGLGSAVTFPASGTYLPSTYAANYSITTPGYLGPNSAMTGNKQLTYTVYLFNSPTPSPVPTTIAQLNTNYGTAGAANQASMTFLFTGASRIAIILMGIVASMIL